MIIRIVKQEIYGLVHDSRTGIIVCMRPANERRRHNVASSLIGWAHAQNGPCSISIANALEILQSFTKPLK